MEVTHFIRKKKALYNAESFHYMRHFPLRLYVLCLCVWGVFFCRCLPPHFTILVGSANSFVALLYARLSFELSVRTGNILLSGQHPWTKQLGRTSCFLFDFRFRPHHRPLFQFFFSNKYIFCSGGPCCACF